MESKTRTDCYSEITNAIIADLEKGVRPWTKPWETTNAIPCRPLRVNGEPYRGINILLLWSAMESHGYREILAALERGDIDAAKLAKDISTKTRQYAKRSLTWWRRDPRIHWLNPLA